MTGACIPPSPNWYCPGVADASDSGLYCFASKNSVVVFDARAGVPELKTSWPVSTERVSCVAFSRSQRSGADDEAPALLTVSDDKSLKVWDVNTRRAHHHTSSNAAVSYADWRGSLSTSVVFAGGDKGSLFVWDLVSGTVIATPVHAAHPIQLVRSHPKDPDMVAVGYKNGLVVVQGLKKGSNAVFKLKGHSEEIVSLSWRLGDSSDLEEHPYLCSTALDKTLRIWDVHAEKSTQTLKVPISSKRCKVDPSQKGRLWIAAVWVPGTPKQVACSTICGDICLRDLATADAEWEFLSTDDDSAGHSRCVFNVSLLKTSSRIYAISTSIDRNIVFWDLASKRSAYCLPSLGGYAYHMEFSPVACASLAIGAGDNTLKVWRTDSVVNPYCCSSFWQGVRGRVMVVAWHPRKDNLVAFGTDEGKVGIVDVLGKQTVVSVSYHRQATYGVCWAELPVGSDKALKTVLLSCGDGKVKVHHLPKMDREALDLDSILLKSTPGRTRRITVNYSERLGFLTIANQDGAVDVYEAKTLRKLAVLEAQRKPVESLSWHPCQTLSSECRSNFSHWLACSSTNGTIFLYDLSKLASPSVDVLRMLQPSLQLSGHSAKVVCLAWSPFRDGMLASASYDETVQVWDVGQGKPVANYRGHSGRVFSVCWSPLDPDVLFSGGEDATVNCWKLSEQGSNLPPSKQRKTKSDGDVTSVADETQSVELQSTDGGSTETAKESKGASEKEGNDTSILKPAGAKSSGTKKKSKSAKSFFPLFSGYENRPKQAGSDDFVLLANLLSQRDEGCTTTDGLHTHLGMYVDDTGAMAVVDAEIQHHKRELNFDYAFQMMLWKGDVSSALQEAAAQRKLTDTLVALSSMVSRATWLDMCQQFAVQLSSDGEHHKAALYLLACHKALEAVQLLRKNGLVREALCVARAHLPEGDSEVTETYVAWAEKACAVGNYEQAAKCHLAGGDIKAAVSMLLNRRDPHSLKSAAYVAKKFGLAADAEVAFSLALRSALVHRDWDAALVLIEEQEKSRAFASFVHLHRGLCHAIDKITGAKPDTLEQSGQTDVVLWKSADAVSAKFLDAVKEAFESNGYSPLQNTRGFSELSELLGYGEHISKEVLLHESRDQILFQVAGCLTVALFSPNEWKLYVARALEAASVSSCSLFAALCKLMFCGEISNSRFTNEIIMNIGLDRFLLFDKLIPEGEAGRTNSFECPKSSKDLLERFEVLKGVGSRYDIGREALGLYLCVGILDSCDASSVTDSKTAVAEQLSALALCPVLACRESTLRQLQEIETRQLKQRLEALTPKNCSTEEAEKAQSLSTDLESRSQAWRQRWLEFKRATEDCLFPDQEKLLARLLELLGGDQDEKGSQLRAKLESWRLLLLDA
ncbi:hypothetical protein HPB47_004750 [Ixodes persulcatus]|uniref:Uncharacterized protein n=1 Tax=Ixodes persulcatus TaxID=34615 RepID=A0AC60PEX5_IXOPE|nr:hypothetical protein HPB47_004750 [Ixodes persulcatus]